MHVSGGKKTPFSTVKTGLAQTGVKPAIYFSATRF